MSTWKTFIDSLDTNGGHVLILLLLVAVGAHWHNDVLFIGANAALLMKLKESGSNRERDSEKAIVATETLKIQPKEGEHP